MLRQLTATLLMLTLIVPLNAVAAASMVVSVSAHEGMAPEHHSHHAEHGAGGMSALGQVSAMDTTHDHNAEDCDDYCMSCSSHCSSSAIVSSSKSDFELDRQFQDLVSTHTLSRAYLLFRPPIRA